MTYSTQRRPWTIPISPQVATPRNISNASRLSTTHPPLHKGLKRTPEQTRPSPITTASNTISNSPSPSHSALRDHHHHIQKSERKKQPKTPKESNPLATIDTPAAFYRLSLSASEQLFSNPVLSFLLFPELLLAKKAYSTSENTLFPPLVSKRIQALRCFLCKHLLICMQSLMWKIGNEGMRGMQGVLELCGVAGQSDPNTSPTMRASEIVVGW